MTQGQKTKQAYEDYFNAFAREVSYEALSEAEGLLNQLSMEVPEVVQRLKQKNPRIMGENLTLFCVWMNSRELWLRRETAHRVFAEEVMERVWKIFYEDLSREMKHSPIKEQLAAWQEDIELQCMEYSLAVLEDDGFQTLAAGLFKNMEHPARLFDDEKTLERVSRLLQDLQTHIQRWNENQSRTTEFQEKKVIRCKA